jgi:hypothetical protein
VLAPYRPGRRHGHRRRRRVKTQHKTQLLASDYRTFYLAKLLIFVTRKGPSTHVIDATSFVERSNATIGAEELANISSYQTLSADKNSKSY